MLVWATAGCTSDPIQRTDSADGPRSDLPQPTGHIVTRWRQDPFAYGSYSYLAVGATPADRAVISTLIDRRLVLAGEATDQAHPSTVHGALQAGRDAAKAVSEAGATSVLVVGAGMAGVGAAQQLTEEGVQVQLLEGRDRIGGRIHTDTSLGVPLDLGASWIHGERGNPLTEIADDADVDRIETDYDSIEVRSADGSLLDYDDVPYELVELLEIVNEYAADIDQLAPGFDDEGEDDRGADVLFPGGYRQLVDHLADGLDITTSAVVDRVTLTDDGRARVAAGTDTWEADAVIVTVPLGVLQHDVISFDPPLPAATRAAIDRLGMGHLSKVYLRFDEVFWDEDVEVIGHVSDPLGAFPVWFNMYPSTGEPILLAFHGGRAADALTELSDEQIVAQATAALEGMYGG
ncbi:MAG: polyamine oxidase [Nonlabens sp.]|jgi:polyamine oxidase